MSIKTKAGKPADDELPDKWAGTFESGEWPEGKTVVLGRPKLTNEVVKSVTFKLPLSEIIALDQKAKNAGETRSEALRQAVERYLESA